MSEHKYDGMAVVGGAVRSEKRTIAFKFCDFAGLDHEKGKSVVSGSLMCHGYSWSLVLYPRGSSNVAAEEEHISVFLKLISKAKVKVDYTIRFGGRSLSSTTKKRVFDGTGSTTENHWGWADFMKREEALEKLNDGFLLIEVDIQAYFDKPKPLIPRDTLSGDMLRILERGTRSDVTFLVDEKKFCLHYAVLAVRAPTLAELAEDAENGTEIVIRDVDEAIFNAFVHFVYASEPPPAAMLDEKSRDLLDVADRYGCINLKLLAESKLVESGVDSANAADLLLLADSKSCALLKEAALNYIKANTAAVMQSQGWAEVKQSATLLSEIMETAHSQISPADDGDDLDRMTITALRSELQKKRLSEDGTREMLVERLKKQRVEK